MSIIGFILSGGKGSRLGGINKGLYSLLGRPMISYVYDRLLPQVDRIIVSANQNINEYEALGYNVIHDKEDFLGLGPLAGLESLSEYVEEGDVIQVVSCDDPLLPFDLVERHYDVLMKNDVELVYPQVNDRAHYALLQCKASVLGQVSESLNARKLKIRDFMAECRCLPVNFDDEKAFLNINTPDDVFRIEDILRKGE